MTGILRVPSHAALVALAAVVVVLTGCSSGYNPATGPGRPAPVATTSQPAPPPAPAPVPAAATLTGTCTVSAPVAYDAGLPPFGGGNGPSNPPSDSSYLYASNGNGGWDYTGSGSSMPSYTMTLSNTSSVSAQISQITTVFFSQGSELISDQQLVNGLIVPGQSLSWTFNVPGQLVSETKVGTVGPANDGGDSYSDGDEIYQVAVSAGSCSLGAWG